MKLFGAQSGKTLVEVLVGKFGRYVKLTRDGEKSRWLNLSDNVWLALGRHSQEVAELTVDYDLAQGGLTLKLTRNWSLGIHDYLGKRYVSLNQSIGDRVNRMNFNTTEWDQLIALNDDVVKALDLRSPESDYSPPDRTPGKTPEEVMAFIKDVKRKSEATPRDCKKRCVWPSKIDVYGVGEDVYATECRALLYRSDADPKKMTIDTVPSKDLATLVGRREFSVELNRLRKESCNGCRIDHPSQMQHPCLMDDWNLDLENRYEDIKKGVPLETYVEKVCAVFDALNLPRNRKEARDLYENGAIKEAAKEGYVANPVFERLIHRCID